MDEKKPIAIILPTKDNELQLLEAVESLRESTDYPFKLIVLESNKNGLHELSYLKTLEREVKNEQYIKAGINPIDVIIKKVSTEGINIRAINEGIKLTTDEDILLIHDDIVFFKLYKRDWLKEIVDIINSNERIGMVTYKGNIKHAGVEYFGGLAWIGSWFCFIPRRVINKVGYYEEL